MFFKDRIKNIQKGDKVLEIGPGSTPHPRSDEFLELLFNDEIEEQAQFGHTGKLLTSKPINYYQGGIFPFKNKSFDYVICSHVLEHVDNVELFLKEISRVSNKGYLEYPNIYYDYLFNFKVHQNFLHYSDGLIHHMKKEDTALSDFKHIQNGFTKLLDKGHFSILIHENIDFFMEGFEWNSKIESKKITDKNDVTPNLDVNASSIENYILKNVSIKTLLTIIVSKVRNKFR